MERIGQFSSAGEGGRDERRGGGSTAGRWRRPWRSRRQNFMPPETSRSSNNRPECSATPAAT